MPQHADLTGADLHEPKGVATATADTVYVADGLGTGSWDLIDADNIDTASIHNINKFDLVTTMVDISTSDTIYVAIPEDCTFVKAKSVIHGALGTADVTLTFANHVGTTIGTIVVTQSGSAAGDVDTLAAASNNTFTENQVLRITTDGASSNTVPVTITLSFTHA